METRITNSPHFCGLTLARRETTQKNRHFRNQKQRLRIVSPRSQVKEERCMCVFITSNSMEKLHEPMRGTLDILFHDTVIEQMSPWSLLFFNLSFFNAAVHLKVRKVTFFVVFILLFSAFCHLSLHVSCPPDLKVCFIYIYSIKFSPNCRHSLSLQFWSARQSLSVRVSFFT